jgi:endo-1,4-beta-D-glucanase Y
VTPGLAGYFVLALFSFISCPALAQAQEATPAVTPDAQWQTYRNRFISSEGRLIDDSAANVSHTEGQGYGMLLAAFADDRQAFASLWAWTQANLYIRGDGLAAWRWRPQDDPHVLDRNNATDGDILVTWALVEAGRRWRNPAYLEQAHKNALAIARRATYDSNHGRTLSPGVAGYGPSDADDGPVVNLSYWVFPAFDALGQVAPEVDWAAIRASGLTLIDEAKFGPRRLPSDWISLKNGPRPAAKFATTFGYDAIRIPLYLAWDSRPEKSRLQAFDESWAGAHYEPPSVIDVVTGAATAPFAEDGYLAVAALVRCAVDGERFPENLRIVHLDRYYSATLHMLSLAAARQRLPQCL